MYYLFLLIVTPILLVGFCSEGTRADKFCKAPVKTIKKKSSKFFFRPPPYQNSNEMLIGWARNMFYSDKWAGTYIFGR